jgi:hypothetical protein
MPARDDECDQRQRYITVLQKQRLDVPRKMVHSHEGTIQRQRK